MSQGRRPLLQIINRDRMKNSCMFNARVEKHMTFLDHPWYRSFSIRSVSGSLLLSAGLAILLLLTGCGGGGGGGNGGGGTATVLVSDTDALITPGTVVRHSMVGGMLNVFALPTPGGVATFGVTIVHTASSPTYATVEITAPPTGVTAALAQPAVDVSTAASTDAPGPMMLANRAAEPPGSPRLPPGQLSIDQQLRARLRGPSLPRLSGRLGNLVRAEAGQPPVYADHRNEQLGDTITLWIYARSTLGIGTEYVQRQATLRRIGAHCKIFVDPDDFQGLSAVTGPYAISDADLDQMVTDFDTVGWPLITGGYGQPWDIDQDGKISIFFSPLVAKNGFAGFFDTKHFEQVNADGSPNDKGNNRDLIAIWSPGLTSEWVGEKWLSAARETCIHEFQHLVSYSLRAAQHDWPRFLADDKLEEVWLDECMAVAAEARFRILRGDPAGEDRFNSYAAGDPAASSLTGFAWNLAAYGHLGLFGLYLWEQGGDEAIRSIVQASTRGKATIDAVFASRGGLLGLYPDFGMAVLTEGLRSQGKLSAASHAALPARYRFARPLGLTLRAEILSGGTTKPAIAPLGTSYHLVTLPLGFAQSSYSLTMTGPDGITVSVIRLP